MGDKGKEEKMRALVATLLVAILMAAASCKKTNQAPDAPAVPSGPSGGQLDSIYSFSSSASDPDGDSVALRFSWGDGDTSVWSAYVPPGEKVAMSHTWSRSGSCSIRAQAKDEDAAFSAWSEPHQFEVAPRLAWDKTFGGASVDYGHSVQQTTDGGYVITGYTESYGAGFPDVWLIKTDGNGNKTWDKTFGGYGYDDGFSVRQTADGGYVITGSTESNGAGGFDVWLIKTDASGNKTWDKTFGGDGFDDGFSVQQTADGGYVITGYTESYGAGFGDVWLIKTDGNGNKTWDKTFGSANGSCGCSVQQTADGGYVITGRVYSCVSGSRDVWLIRTDANGNKTWDRTFGGDSYDCGYSVQQTADGGYVITGSTAYDGACCGDIWLIKME